jgi:hypothetical protein
VNEKKFKSKEIKYIILYILLPSGTVIDYGSVSDFLTSYGSGSTSQKVKVPVPVPQGCLGVHFGVVAPQRTPPGGGGAPALSVEVGVVLHTYQLHHTDFE